MTDREDFLARLCECRDICRSVNGLAAKAGLATATVQAFFKGRELRRTYLIMLANAAGVRPGWLLTGELPKFPETETSTPKAPEISPVVSEAFQAVSGLADQLVALGLIDGGGMAQRLARAMAEHLCREAGGQETEIAPAPSTPIARAWSAARILAAELGGKPADYMKDGQLLAAAHAQSPKPKGDAA